MGLLLCPRCTRVTVFDPSIPDEVEKTDAHLCMDCIYDDEENIVRGEK